MSTNILFCLVLAFVLVSVGCKKKPAGTPTQLHYAATAGNIQWAQILIAKDSDVNAKDNLGCTPLDAAVSYDNKDVAELLVAAGADATIHSATYLGEWSLRLNGMRENYFQK